MTALQTRLPGGLRLDQIYRPTIKLEDLEKAWIKLAMEHHKGNITAAACSLGISRATMYRKIGEINGTNSKQNYKRS